MGFKATTGTITAAAAMAAAAAAKRTATIIRGN